MSKATRSCDSTEDTLARLDELVQEAGVPSQVPRIARAVDLVVFMEQQGRVPCIVEILQTNTALDRL